MKVNYRPITPTEAAVVTYHRRAMFEAMGHRDPTILESMEVNFLGWVQRRLEEGSYVGWFGIDHDEGDRIIAGAGIWLQDWPPHILDPLGPRAYILNIYVEPTHRRLGIARKLTQHCIEWSHEQKIKVITLHYSDAGKSLYESMGFSDSNEMRMNLT